MDRNIKGRQFEISKLKYLQANGLFPHSDAANEFLKDNEKALEHDKQLELEEAKHGSSKKITWKNVLVPLLITITGGVIVGFILHLLIK